VAFVLSQNKSTEKRKSEVNAKYDAELRALEEQYNQSNQSIGVKEVEKLFDENPELANQVYEALGINVTQLKEDEAVTNAFLTARQHEEAKRINSGEFDDVRLNLKEELEEIIKKSSNPLFVELAKKLKDKESLNKIKAYSTQKPFETNDGFKPAATYQAETQRLILFLGNTERFDGKEKYYQYLLHELVHHFVDRELVLTNSRQAENIRQLYEYAKYQLTKKGKQNLYGLKNVHEFVAEAFTNIDFQRELKNLPVPEQFLTKSFNLFDYFLELISKLLGTKSSVLEAVIYQATDIFEIQEYKKSLSVTPEQKQQALKIYSDYVRQTGRQDIEGFIQFIKELEKQGKQQAAQGENIPSNTIEPGRYVKYKGETYIVTKINKNGTIQIYNPEKEGTGSKKSVSKNNLTPTDALADIVEYKGKKYIVTPKDTIISLTTNKKMNWGENNKERKAILKLRDEKNKKDESKAEALQIEEEKQEPSQQPSSRAALGAKLLAPDILTQQELEDKNLVETFELEGSKLQENIENLFPISTNELVNLLSNKISDFEFSRNINNKSPEEKLDIIAIKAAINNGLGIREGINEFFGKSSYLDSGIYRFKFSYSSQKGIKIEDEGVSYINVKDDTLYNSVNNRINSYVKNIEEFNKLVDEEGYFVLLNAYGHEDAANSFSSEFTKELIDSKKIKFIDTESGKECNSPGGPAPQAAAGMAIGGITLGGEWEIVKEFVGPSHTKGGINITVGENGVRITKQDNSEFKAEYGLVIPASDFDPYLEKTGEKTLQEKTQQPVIKNATSKQSSKSATSDKTTRQLWEEETGLPWSVAREEGLTSGSYEDNMKLRHYLSNKNYSQYDMAKIAPRIGTRVYQDKDGSTWEESYKMAWAERDGIYYAFPTIFQNEDGTWVDSPDPLEEAIKRGEAIPFTDKHDAAIFAAGAYKKYSDRLKRYFKPLKN
jgi:hypothetical protein